MAMDSYAKVRVDTRAVDGLRAVASFHIMLGHFVMDTDWSFLTTGVQDFESFDMINNVDLMGGASLGLFYMISGFVMALGYAQTQFRAPVAEDQVSCGGLERICCAPCDMTGCCGMAMPSQEEDLPLFNSASFFRKRFARLAPMFWIANLASGVNQLSFGMVQLDAAHAGKLALTAFGVTSWFGMRPWPLSSSWAISTIGSFYFFFPALVPRLQRVSKASLQRCVWALYTVQAFLYFACIVIAYIFFVVQGGVEGYPAGGLPEPSMTIYWMARVFPPFRLPVFVMGCLCALQVIHRHRAAEALSSKSSTGCVLFHPATGFCFCWLGCLASASCLAMVVGPAAAPIRAVVEVFMPMLFYYWMLSLTAPDASASCVVRLFRTRPFSFVADISMSLYLVHPIVVRVITFSTSGQDRPMPGWGVLVALPSSLLGAWLLTQLVERPLQTRIRGSVAARGFDGSTKTPGTSLVAMEEAVVGDPVGTRSGACSGERRIS